MTNEFDGDAIFSSDTFLPPPSDFAQNRWAPIPVAIGIALALFGFLEAKWVLGKAFFGLLKTRLAYSQIRLLWEDFGAPSFIIKFFVSSSHVLGYCAMFVAALGATSTLVKQVEISTEIRISGAAFIGGAALMQLVVVFGLISAESNISTLFGAWLAPIGLGVASLGFWLSTARSQN